MEDNANNCTTLEQVHDSVKNPSETGTNEEEEDSRLQSSYRHERTNVGAQSKFRSSMSKIVSILSKNYQEREENQKSDQHVDDGDENDNVQNDSDSLDEDEKRTIHTQHSNKPMEDQAQQLEPPKILTKTHSSRTL